MTKAILLLAPSEVAVRNVDKPQPGAGEILVKVHAAALNPTDVKHIENKYPTVIFNTVSGCDYAGTVEALGPSVADNQRHVGERVAGIVHGASRANSGAFAEYLVADAKLVFTLPDSLSFEDAAGLGVCTLTACQMLYQSQSLPKPGTQSAHPIPLLVWSGASAVGQYVIQLASLGGMQVVTTASPKHNERLKALGAAAVFDYNDPNVSTKIKDFTGGKLSAVADCLSEKDSSAKIFAAIGDSGGTVSVLMPVKTDGLRDDVRTERSVAYTLLGKAMVSPYSFPAQPVQYAAAIEYCQIVSSLLAQGKLKTTPVKLFHGLESVEDGIAYMRAGKVSGEKVTFKIV